MVADEGAIAREIPANALGIAGVALTLQGLPRRPDILPEQLGRRGLPGEDGDDALRGVPLSVAVAAPGGLQDRVQTGHLPVDRREIHVHARLDQGGGDHPAGQAVHQALAHGLQNLLPMDGAHQRGQVEAALARQQRMDILGGLAAVDDAQHLLLRAQFLGQRRIGAFADAAEGDAAEGFVQLRGVGADFLRAELRGKGLNQIVQNRLGGRAQHRAGPEVRHQAGDRPHTGQQGVHGQHLRLVKDDHAVGDVVQLAALGGAVGMDGFKELHRRGHDHRRIPVLAGQALAALFTTCLLIGIENCAAVVLEDVVLPEDVPEYEGVLFDDGGVGNHIDDAPHVVPQGVPQRKGQRGQGLAAARGHGQRVDALLPRPGLRAVLQDPAAQAVQRTLGWIKALDVPLQSIPEHRQRIAAAALHHPAGHEFLGVQIVRIHQTGVEHPRPHGQAIAVVLEVRLRRNRGQRAAPFVGRNAALHALLQPPAECGGSRHVHLGIPEVRQAAVVADHAAGGYVGPDPCAFDGPGGGVVDLRSTFLQPPLEGRTVLPDVVGKAHQPAVVRTAEVCGKRSAASRSALQMLRNRLHPAVPGNVGQVN